MFEHFAHTPGSGRAHTLLTSAFSHRSLWHLLVRGPLLGPTLQQHNKFHLVHITSSYHVVRELCVLRLILTRYDNQGNHSLLCVFASPAAFRSSSLLRRHRSRQSSAPFVAADQTATRQRTCFWEAGGMEMCDGALP